jgi:hypothetical protein
MMYAVFQPCFHCRLSLFVAPCLYLDLLLCWGLSDGMIGMLLSFGEEHTCPLYIDAAPVFSGCCVLRLVLSWLKELDILGTDRGSVTGHSDVMSRRQRIKPSCRLLNIQRTLLTMPRRVAHEQVNIGCLSAQSLGNKSAVIADFVLSNNFSVLPALRLGIKSRPNVLPSSLPHPQATGVSSPLDPDVQMKWWRWKKTEPDRWQSLVVLPHGRLIGAVVSGRWHKQFATGLTDMTGTTQVACREHQI